MEDIPSPQATKLMQSIHESLTTSCYANLPDLCQQLELELALAPGSCNPFYGVHLLSLLLANQLEEARFLWRRLPTEHKVEGGELAAIWRVGQALWRRDYVQVYEGLQAFAWTDNHKVLVAALEESSRQRAFNLLSHAYTTVAANDCALFLGMPVDATIKACQERGWKWDAETKFLTPSKLPVDKTQETDLQQLSQLTEYVVHLEKQ